MMWFALIAALLGMSALTIIQTPREWLKRPLPLALLILFHAAGIASILLILFAVYRIYRSFPLLPNRKTDVETSTSVLYIFVRTSLIPSKDFGAY